MVWQKIIILITFLCLGLSHRVFANEDATHHVNQGNAAEEVYQPPNASQDNGKKTDHGSAEPSSGAGSPTNSHAKSASETHTEETPNTEDKSHSPQNSEGEEVKPEHTSGHESQDSAKPHPTAPPSKLGSGVIWFFVVFTILIIGLFFFT